MLRFALIYAALICVRAACPTFTTDEVPSVCLLAGAPPNKEKICTVCIDACVATLTRVAPDIVCDELLTTECLRNIVSVFAAAGGDVQSFLQCDPAELGRRSARELKCKGQATPKAIARVYETLLPSATVASAPPAAADAVASTPGRSLD